GNFPAANGRFQELVSAVLQERNLIDEVGKEVILDVGDRPSIVIFPSKIRVGNGVQISCASAAVVGIIRVGISVAHLVGQIVPQRSAAERQLQGVVIPIRLVFSKF